MQFTLAKGTGDSYQILLWLSGSTYRATGEQALLLSVGVVGLTLLALGLSRWLTLISIGRGFASARGLSASRASLVLLILVALLCALVTATMGPVSFVGLIAPHMAMMLGAPCSISTSAGRLGRWYFDVVGRLVGASLVIPRANCRRHASGNHWWQLFPAAVTQSACTLNPKLRGVRLSTHLANVGRNVIDQLPRGRFTLLSEGEKNQVGQHVLRSS